jgi:hypothetical protein
MIDSLVIIINNNGAGYRVGLDYANTGYCAQSYPYRIGGKMIPFKDLAPYP